jgi:DNA-binding MarR family transcriptional regulator
MSQIPSQNIVALWISLMRASQRTLEHIEYELVQAQLPPLSFYDALLEIERAGPEGIRPYELKDRLLLPQYGTSRLLSRIEASGYIRRTNSPKDGRGHFVLITKRGKVVRRKMWPIYAESLKAVFEDKFNPSDIARLTEGLNLVGRDI